jgi:hypothetical protein
MVPGVFRLLAALLTVCAAAGCATVLTPPAIVTDPVTVYVTDYGRHSSLILPRGGGYTEYAFGQWEWFAQGKTGLLRGPLVVMVPGQSTLGRRGLGEIANEGEASRKADGASARALVVERAKAEALVAELDARFEAEIETRIEGPDGMEFVKDPRVYTMLHNSNGVTADWLRQLGVGVQGSALRSNFRVAGASAKDESPG